MIVTGFKLQQALREAEHTKTIIAGQWSTSLYAFDGEIKTSPEDIMRTYQQIEHRMGKLQLAQAQYNLLVEVNVLGTVMTLCEAVKLVGGAGRAEKMWRTAAGAPKLSSWELEKVLNRDRNTERAQPTIKSTVALAQAKSAARYASALREAIATGNSREIDINWLESSLFEE